ncbi:hypothetical protein [Nannocystis sp.]|uniref:hypothetical protein n=1 Tax=Nannocystis sp. TaxID=1962667 RepID=UPI0024267B60|nr:hypothetical protein [Nannocystis sp.]MBK7826626.1 hypothetical protein [Nannocystis sp.]MBK9754246.1 hypothetical protein [Nannocystis sp.]
MRNALSASCIFITAFATGCGDDKAGDEAGGTTEAASTSGGEDPTTGEPFVPFPARGGIVITAVEANPGVAVPIGKEGAPVGGKDRTSYIPKGRDTLIRAFVDVPDDWTPRPIEARLMLSGGGVDQTLQQTVTISEDSFVGDLTSTFYFGVHADVIVPGLKYQIELWEAAPGQEGLPEAPTPVALKDGPGPVGVESAFTEMRVVLVPIDYSYESCNQKVDGEAQRKAFEDALFQQNGIASLELEVHAPYKVDYDMVSFGGLSQLVNEMSQLRTVEAADDNVYYYALFDSCHGCIGDGGIQGGCTVGLAADITGPDPGDAHWRAAAGQLIGNAAETFVHEIGHTQGRQHVYCAGAGVQAQGTDPTYPHEDGRIGVWGFGVRDYKLRHPTANSDYMSYCGQVWVSDWQWNATYNRIVTLSQWEKSGAGQPAGAGGGVLIAAVDPDGKQMWWTGPGGLSSSREASATHSVIFEFTDGEVEAQAQVSVRPHYATRNIVAALPAGFDERELVSVKLRDEQGERRVEAAAIRRLHHPDRLRDAR